MLIFWYLLIKEPKSVYFKYADIICQLEALLKQKVDLVEESTFLPFAQQTASEDKILIYEKSYSTPSLQPM